MNRELQRELQKQQRRLINLEEDISKASTEKARLEQALTAPQNYADKKNLRQLKAIIKKLTKNCRA
ncbi:MAG: hypothetical protein WKG06_40560 [Segetibacter sp.]